MADGGSAEGLIPLFSEDEVPTILAAILKPSSGLTKRHETEWEDHITNRLFAALIRLKKIRSASFVPVREYLLISHDGERIQGKIDISFVEPSGGYCYFAIEAKRLHVTFAGGEWHSLAGEYVTGDQGMMCFITGKYSPALRSGGMLGYVFDRRIEKATAGIAGLIQKSAEKLRLSPPRKLVESNILPGESRIRETRHDLSSRPFVMYHILVPV